MPEINPSENDCVIGFSFFLFRLSLLPLPFRLWFRFVWCEAIKRWQRWRDNDPIIFWIFHLILSFFNRWALFFFSHEEQNESMDFIWEYLLNAHSYYIWIENQRLVGPFDSHFRWMRQKPENIEEGKNEGNKFLLALHWSKLMLIKPNISTWDSITENETATQ